MSARAVVLVADNRQLMGRWRLAGVALILFGAGFGGGPLVTGMVKGRDAAVRPLAGATRVPFRYFQSVQPVLEVPGHTATQSSRFPGPFAIVTVTLPPGAAVVADGVMVEPPPPPPAVTVTTALVAATVMLSFTKNLRV